MIRLSLINSTIYSLLIQQMFIEQLISMRYVPEPGARAVDQIDISPTSINLQPLRERDILKKLSFVSVMTSMQKENRLNVKKTS